MKREPVAIFLCDASGIMAQPWAEAGIRCICVDLQNSVVARRYHAGVEKVWGDVRSWTPPAGVEILFVGAFPPCTDVASSGALHFKRKGTALLRDALEIFEICRHACEWSGAPYLIENPKGVLSTIPHVGAPDQRFHPWEYAGWHEEDHYTKETCLWTGGGFVMPAKRPAAHLADVKPDDRIAKMGEGAFRGDLRSRTPLGFSIATFMSNAPAKYRRA